MNIPTVGGINIISKLDMDNTFEKEGFEEWMNGSFEYAETTDSADAKITHSMATYNPYAAFTLSEIWIN